MSSEQSESANFDPEHDCNLCPRLHEFIAEWRAKEPNWHNGPVPVWADAHEDNVVLLIIGLAPGLRGANRTGRPFTGDYAGDLLFKTLGKFDFAKGEYGSSTADGLTLQGAAIVNSVRCVPPQNRPVGSEINTCRRFLLPQLTRFNNLKMIVTLGAIAHQSTVRALGERVAAHPFGHCAETQIKHLTLLSSYHCSRYNTNTGVLTEKMFEAIFSRAQEICEAN